MKYALMGNAVKKLMTAVEYLESEKASSKKHEFYNGEVYPMAWEKERHNLLVSNLIIPLRLKFKNKHCVGCSSEMKVLIDERSSDLRPNSFSFGHLR